MDIIVKSFNRPYCLDRCIQSIRKFVVDSDYRIVILDDGTPEKYLNKIQEKHKDVVLFKSALYNEKVESISNDLQNISAKVPIDLWIEAAKNATDYFVLLEDDIWFTDYIVLSELEYHLKKDRMQMLKLFWLGNPKLISNKIKKQEVFYTIYDPNLYTINPFVYRLVFASSRFKIKQILSFFKIYTYEKSLKYYSIYSVAGAIFDRDYFLTLWANHTNTVDEGLQLKNAVRFYNKNKNVNFGRTNNQVVKTSFLSAATNQHKEYENVFIDMFAFNKVINDAWFEERFDVMNNFPKDFNSETISALLKVKNQADAKEEEWKKWINKFKQQYTSIGCLIE